MTQWACTGMAVTQDITTHRYAVCRGRLNGMSGWGCGQNKVHCAVNTTCRFMFSVHRVHWGGGVEGREGGQWPLYAFKNVDYDALHLPHGVVKNKHFQSRAGPTLLGGREEGGRESQKRVL